MRISKGCHCSAVNCSNNRGKNPELSFFTFPLDPIRCRLWVINCRRTDLVPFNSAYLHKNCRLCPNHFEQNQFMNNNRNSLIKTAVPTLFAAGDNPKQMRRKRRTKPGDLDLSDSGAPSVDDNEASDGAGPAEVNDEGSSFSRDDFENCDLSDVKVKVEHTDDFCSEPETKRQRVEDYQEESKLEEALTILRDLKQSYGASQGPNDRFTLYGQHVASKLRGYGEKTSAIVEHAINNILFEADMGNYDGIHTALPSHDDSAQ